MRTISFLLLIVIAWPGLASGAVEPIAPKVPHGMPDALRALSPSQVRMDGYLGQRIDNNVVNRLLVVNEDGLLAGFRKRPGSHPWIGEHVGKYLHAATLAWAYSGDDRLKAKIDRIVVELIKCQEPDGYLGTYVPEERWTSWDVWVHKYCLIGLLTYHQYTGDPGALEASRKIGDLLVATFPAKKSIIAAGTHVGMAATSVLEPMVVLYRHTGEKKYLDFCRYIVGAYDEPNGPKIIQSLLEVKRVDKTANGKAYEMMSNLVGLCELARTTGDKAYLAPAVIAWEDIVANHLYITGTVSQREHFNAPHDLPNSEGAHVGETCATVTWIQLNAQLLALTGEPRYADELERTFYNHLAAAQRPDGAQWCYFTSLVGRKPYGPGTNCCVSSGPRGMALVPQAAFFTYRSNGRDGVALNLFPDARQATAALDGRPVTVSPAVRIKPGEGVVEAVITVSFRMAQPATFGFKVRCPWWAEKFSVEIPGGEARVAGQPGQWAEVPPRQWADGSTVLVSFDVPLRLVRGEHTNKGYSALMFGPMVLAYDGDRNKDLPPSGTLGLLGAARPLFNELMPVFEAPVRTASAAQPRFATFLPFADAGATGSHFRVWMRNPDNLANISLLSDGREARSRSGNVSGSIIDGDPGTYVVTFNNQPAAEDWYAVELPAPMTIRRVVFAHGHTFHDGGWFDASAGKPRIQIQREKNAPWQTLGELADYPDTTATDSKGLKDAQTFTLQLNQPASIVALRVIGKPATGDNPKQAFSSCAELGAYAD